MLLEVWTKECWTFASVHDVDSLVTELMLIICFLSQKLTL
jgi:hypothetical protein